MKLVTAAHLKQWAEIELLGARADLPDLVRSLVRASCPGLEYYRFPGSNASQTHGWDGVVETTEATTFVPEKRSIWELGAGADYATKASAEFTKRTGQLSDAERMKHAFVFVTPRIWDTGLEDWIKNRSGYGWREVRLYDGNSLEHWLEDCPGVAIPLARKLGLMPTAGVQTIHDFWDEYRLNTNPPLKEDLLLAGREERAKQLVESFGVGRPGLSKWKADSAIEASLFIAAAIMRAEGELSDFLLSRTLFVASLDGAKALPASGNFNLILLTTAGRVGASLARTNQVTLVLGVDDIAANVEVLERMNTRNFARGLHAMGIDEREAFHLAGTCGRSVLVFSRLHASATFAAPAWRDIPELIPLVLAGGWDASNEHDQAVIAALCAKPYDEVDDDARRLSAIPDAPIDLDGSVWTIRSPKDAFTLIGALVGNGHQQRLRNACVTVFSEIDLTLEVPDEQQPIIPTVGDDFRHSEWLRRGLSTTLLLIAGLHEAARFRTAGASPGLFVENVVAGMPGLTTDIRLLASLKSEFSKLMEAAPHPLASALEHVLEGESETWAPIIFRGTKDSHFFSQTSPHTYILWALEMLAWNPEYLLTATSILMRLAQVDPGGATQNRPLRSLRSIFLAWRPNTYASVEQRVAVLRSLCVARPKVGLDLALSLLPVLYDVSSDTPKPRLRDFGDAASKPATDDDIQSAFRAYAGIAVELAGVDARQLTYLVDHLPEFDPCNREIIATAIRSAVQRSAPDDAFELWSKLRGLVRKHQEFANTSWAIRSNELKPLQALCEEIAPDDPILRVLWQFEDLVPTIGLREGGDYVEEAGRIRTATLDQLLQERGVTAVMQLARGAKQPYLVGFAFAEAAVDREVLKRGIELALARESEVDEDFVLAISAGAHQRFGKDWDTWIGEIATSLDTGRAANLFLRWNDSRETWAFVETLGETIDLEYWRRKPAYRQVSDEDTLYALDKYMTVGRFSACIDLLSYEESRASTDLCIKILRGFVGEANNRKWRQQHTLFSVLHMISTLQQRDDTNVEELAAIEYRFLPLLEHQGEPVALNRMLESSPKFFVEVICDVYVPSSLVSKEVTEDQRLRAQFGYRMLQSMKSVPGFSPGKEDIEFLRGWVLEARRLAREADRAAITDLRIGEILAFATADSGDEAWPTRSIRGLIEEVASDEIERGITVSRFNMRGVFRKDLYEGGAEERTFVDQYRQWAEASVSWPRTCAMLRRIAADWEQTAEKADTLAQLNQVRDS